MYALATSYPRERRDRRGQPPREGNGPLAVVITARRRALAGEQLDIIERGLAINCLSDIHPSLTQDADRAVADQMADEACKGQRSGALVLVGEVKTHLTCDQLITDFICGWLIERPLQSDDHAIATAHQLARLDPAAIGAQDPVIRRANQLASVL